MYLLEGITSIESHSLGQHHTCTAGTIPLSMVCLVFTHSAIEIIKSHLTQDMEVENDAEKSRALMSGSRLGRIESNNILV